MPPLEETLILASRLHGGQVDKRGEPYILHPLRLMVRGKSPVERTVALLHDVLEDCPITLQQLAQLGYGEDILTALDALTHRPDESYEDYILRAKAHPLAARIKIWDLEDNMDLRLPFCDAERRDLPRLQRYRRAWAVLHDLPLAE